MVGSVLTNSSSITRGFVRARYAFALRAIPALDRDAFSGVSVVLTVAVTRSVGSFCLANQLCHAALPIGGTGGTISYVIRAPAGSPGAAKKVRNPALASKYHT